MLSDGNLNMASYFGMSFSPCYADVSLSDGDEIMLSDIETAVGNYVRMYGLLQR
jgi:hypothetical protein